MKAMVINQYGPAEEVFELADNMPVPTIKDHQILVRNISVSVNPIDVHRRAGYGRDLFARYRKPEFPYILGCDGAGIVEAVGDAVTDFKKGDEVCYLSSSFQQGVYSEFSVIEQQTITHKPKNVDFPHAAALPFVALTTWTALVTKAKLSQGNAAGKKVLVHAGAGGVGSFAIQLLKHWGCDVATTCSGKNIDFVKSLGADTAIDYQTQDYAEILSDYDIVFDTLGIRVPGTEKKSINLLKPSRKSAYVTIVHPFMKNIDTHGLLTGLLINGWQQAKKKLTNRPIIYSWVMYRPNQTALKEVMKCVEQGVIKIFVDQEFPLEQVAKAHEHVESRRTRGKVILNIGA